MNTGSTKKSAKPKKSRASHSAIYKACTRYLGNPSSINIDEKIDEALTHSAILNIHSDIEVFLSANEDHEHFDSLIETLDFYSSSHFVLGANEDFTHCALFLVPLVIGCQSNSPEISKNQTDKIAKSFRAHNLLSDDQSISVYPDLLSLENLDFNYVKRKRTLLGMIESMVNKGQTSLIDFPLKQAPVKNRDGELSVCLRYLAIAVMGDAGDLIDCFSDKENENSDAWREYVGAVLTESAETVFAAVDCPDYYSEAIDEGIMSYAINATHLKIARFVNAHNINPEECNIFIGKGDFNEGHDVYLYYKHGERVLDVEKIQLPIPNDEEHFDYIIRSYIECVFSCCEAHRIGGVELFGDEDENDAANSKARLH